MDELFDAIKRKVSVNASSGLDMVGEFDSFEIDQTKFYPINKQYTQKKIAFVDGGSSVVINTPSLVVGFIRSVAVVMQHKMTEKLVYNELYLIATSDESANGMKYNVKFFETKNTKNKIDEISLNPLQSSIANSQERMQLSRMVDVSRRFMELDMLENLTEELDEGDMIILDGNLKSFYPGEKEIFHNIHTKVLEKNILLTAVAKTSNLLTSDGGTVVAELVKKGGVGPWYYYPLYKSRNMSYQAESYFVKLHSLSDYVFSFDVYSEQAKDIDIAKVMGLIAFNSRDVTFPGYPYGLIKADKLARVSNNESEILLTKFMARDKKTFDLLKPYMKAQDAHSVLDSM